MITTSLAALRKAGACYDGYNRLVRALQCKTFTEDDASRDTYIRFRHDDPVALTFILESNGLDDALWSLRASNASDRDCRLYAVWCARNVPRLMDDLRDKAALDVAERFANGLATDDELFAAFASATHAAAQSAAHAEAWHAARCAAQNAAWGAAAHASSDGWEAARADQHEMFIRMCNGTAPWQNQAK